MARTGRPREFERDAALQVALRLFWQHGYEATSLAQLREAMGISSASFYAAFGSKEALFDEVVRAYMASYGRVTEAVADDELPPREAIERILRASARMQTEPEHPTGCLMVLAGAAGSADHEGVRALLAERRSAVRRKIGRAHV